jgi:hypothetical protein
LTEITVTAQRIGDNSVTVPAFDIMSAPRVAKLAADIGAGGRVVPRLMSTNGWKQPPFDGGIAGGIGDFLGIYCFINQ